MMLGITMWLLVGVFAWAFASFSITCPDGNVCSDIATCCMTKHGYSCCPYPKAVCCTDLAHCCPAGFRCDQVTQMCEKEKQLWKNIPMVKKVAAEVPSPPVLPLSPLQELDFTGLKRAGLSWKKTPTALREASGSTHDAGVIRCDPKFYCSQGTTCCKGATGHWSCCPYPLGKCCADGKHCCEYGYTCDPTSLSCRGWYSQIPSGTQGCAETD